MSPERRLRFLLYALTLGGVFVLALSSLTYFDFWWYLKSGELIVQTRSVPTVDPFSFTARGRPWINHMWATQALFYLVWTGAGRIALVVLKAAVVTATFAVVLRTIRRRGVHPVVASAVVLLLAWAGRDFWSVRPQIFTFLGLALFLWLLREGWESRRSIALTLPLLMAAWVNLHAGFVVGLAVIGLVGAGSALPRLVDRERRAAGWRAAALAAGLGLLAGLASLANPFGVQALLFPFEVVQTRAFMVSTYEWFSPNFHDPAYRGFEAVILLLVLAFAWGRARLTAADALVSLAFLHLGLASVRHIPLFLVAAAAPLAVGLDELWRTLRVRRGGAWALLERLRPTLPTLWPLAAAPATPLAVGALAVLMVVTGAGGALLDPDVNPFRLDLNERRYPERTMAFIRAEGLPAPLFNSYAWGGYELWRLYPAYHVFIDGRTHVYGPAVLHDFLAITRVETGWRAVLDKWNIQTILVQPDSALARAVAADPGWRPVFAERDAAVFLRATEANRAVLRRLPAVALARPGPLAAGGRAERAN